jgi:Protein of unknown function (DUF1569)
MHEPHLLQTQAYHDLLERLESLSALSQAIWGKMDVAQMMAHVAANLEMAMGERHVTQNLIGRIFGSIAKRQTLTKGIPKNSPTDPRVKISDRRAFHTEREGLRIQLERFVQRGEAGITRQPHPFFGRMTPNEWARLQYVHMDHHLKQFGV